MARRIRLSETELTNLIRRVVNEDLLLEEAECTIYSGGGDDCPDGYTCKPDPNSTLLGNCCMDSNGKCCDDCMDDGMVHTTDDDDYDWGHDFPGKYKTTGERVPVSRGISEQKRLQGLSWTQDEKYDLISKVDEIYKLMTTPSKPWNK